MKQVKIAYKEYKKKLPNRPPDEIDFGLGFRAALNWIKSQSQTGKSLYMIPCNDIDEELQ